MERRIHSKPAPRPVSSWRTGSRLAGSIVLAFAAAAWISRLLESSAVFEWTKVALLVCVLALVVGALAGLVALFLPGSARGLWSTIGWAALGLAVVIGLEIPWRHAFNEQRVLLALVERFDPLVHAIERFQEARGRAPRALEELVPEFLRELPEAEVFGAVVRPEYGSEETWTLRVDLSLGSWIGYPTGELDYRPDGQYAVESQAPDAHPFLEDGRYRGWHWRIVWW